MQCIYYFLYQTQFVSNSICIKLNRLITELKTMHLLFLHQGPKAYYKKEKKIKVFFFETIKKGICFIGISENNILSLFLCTDIKVFFFETIKKGICRMFQKNLMFQYIRCFQLSR